MIQLETGKCTTTEDHHPSGSDKRAHSPTVTSTRMNPAGSTGLVPPLGSRRHGDGAAVDNGADDDTMPPLEQVPEQELGDDFKAFDDDSSKFQCEFCGAKYVSEVDLIRHQNSKFHRFCSKCQWRFKNWVAVLQHLSESGSHNFCFDCEIDFPSLTALKIHLRSWVHRDLCTCTNVVLCLAVLGVIIAVLVAYTRLIVLGT